MLLDMKNTMSHDRFFHVDILDSLFTSMKLNEIELETKQWNLVMQKL